MITIIPKNRPDCRILIDDADAEKVAGRRWTVVSKPNSISLYAVAQFGKKQVYLHRHILDAKPGQMINHLDGNGLNCTRANIVFCTYSENNRHAATLPGRRIRGPRKEGISMNKVRRRLADGRVRVHIYNRATGEPIRSYFENETG